jgi:hypothetical protein
MARRQLMAGRQKTQKQDQKEEEEHGMLYASPAICACVHRKIQLTAHRRRLLCFWVRHRSAARSAHTDSHSPVIVAENMIGVAMYELVRRIKGFGWIKINSSRFVLATKTW